MKKNDMLVCREHRKKENCCLFWGRYFCCFLLCLFFVGVVHGQTEKVSLSIENVPLQTLLNKLQEQTGFNFVYSEEQVKGLKTFSADIVDEALDDVLKKLLAGTGFSYIYEGKMIVLRKNEIVHKSSPIVMTGKVTDKAGVALPGVTVALDGLSLGTSTDIDGHYKIELPDLSKPLTLIFSFVGMETVKVVYSGQKEINVTLHEVVQEMNEVVVTGIFNKSKESYTGAVTTVSSKEIKMFRGQNLLSTLKNIDPSINFVANNELGSNPNALPEINIRGNSSLPMTLGELNAGASAELNAPLVIMDGFEISLTKLMDFNDEEIESINILKDAAATAIYGSRGANGVIVVTTKSPKAGKMKIYASAGFNMEIPDLSSYDLLDAKDKLALEKSAGFFDDPKNPDKDRAQKKLYNDLLSEVLRGVDTYWLSKPLRTGVGQRYNLRLEGGSDEFRWAVSLGQNEIKGVMKGSERRNFNGSITLSYMYKNILFRNQTSVDFNKAVNSKYGKFSKYAEMNPYWRVVDDKGEYIKQYKYVTGGFVGNPLYDVHLNSKDESKYNQLTNNFSIEWKIWNALTLRAALGLSKQTNSTDKYLPPSHSDFADKKYQSEDNFFKKGKYDYSTGEQVNVNGNVTISYLKTWKERHQLYVGLDYFISQGKDYGYNISVEGFSNDDMDFLGNALQYKDGSKPSGYESTSRQVGFTGNVNYTYDNRYFVDFSYRIDGSSQFGSKKRFAPFWSGGIGWNLHNASFMESVGCVDKLRLRLSYGETGSVKFSSYQALSMFKYYPDDRYLIFNGADLQGLGNENLKWQVTDEWNAGIEFSLWNGLFSASLDVYAKKTSNLLNKMDLVPSTGFNSYTANVGAVKNTGFEAMVSTYLIRDTEKELIWMVSGRMAHNKNRINKLSDAIKLQTEDYVKNNVEMGQLLYEGASQTAIYAVPSLGIDPSTGKELFLDKNGKVTDEWSMSACRNFGDTEPKYRGNVNSMLSYKDLTLNLSFGYQWGGNQYNRTLLDKVEVVKEELKKNVDRRVFDERWQRPGDLKLYKGYTQERTKPSSRFIMKDNVFSLQSVSLQYRWHSNFLKKNLSLQTVNFDLNMSDVFYISSVKRERGTSYPFARRVNFSIALMF